MNGKHRLLRHPRRRLKANDHRMTANQVLALASQNRQALSKYQRPVTDQTNIQNNHLNFPYRGRVLPIGDRHESHLESLAANGVH
jgi:hypothetical protein